MAGSGFLHQYFINNGHRSLHKWFHYFDVYESHFERFRGLAPVVMEIGVFGGGSLSMWKSYFGEGAKIIGLDINPDCKKYEGEGIEIFIGSQTDTAVLDSVLAKYPKIDILIDDGSHRMDHVNATFDHMYERISPNGIYFVEDMHTAYWPRWGGGLELPGTFIENSKKKIDDINAVHSKGARAPSKFTSSTKSISFYDSIVVFERSPQGRRYSIMTHPMAIPESDPHNPSVDKT